ncbi:hypothetical protein JAAARDRAFT_200645 [Jaapia argillacea MUCL 33604]|uniref:Major facilitator superfamily (MFS) profile domain-containing protein n=1 Tax=Jaapia argillacea MUCL 33604 TaxID=933084 RepID=A0A067PF27_9AGAM|nr:hypothetical protein JAAARDRAFT_200645 [Jaapia argillacea MUCL 33604]
MPEETTPLLRDDDSVAKNGRSVTTYTEVVEDGNERNDVEQIEPAEDDSKSMAKLAPTVIPMTIGIFLAAMDQTIVVSSYASIGNEFNQLQNTSWIATGYMLTVTSFQPLYGKLSDIFGRKACLLSAYAIFACGCLCCGLARDMNELIVARALAGIGGGGMSTVVSIIMSDIVPLRQRGTWQGIINIVFATGSATGAPLGGILADSIGWRWAFLAQVPVTLIAILSVSIALNVPKTETGQDDFYAKLKRIDFGGAVTLVLSIFFLLVALDRGGNVSWSDPLTVACLGGFVFFSIFFATVEMKLASEPFAPKRIIINRSLIASYLCNFFGVMSSMCLIYQISLYFQAVRKMSASEAGMGLVPAILGGVVGSLMGGLVMQATGKYYWLTVGEYVGMVSGTLLVTLMTGVLVHSFAGIVVGLVFMSIGNGGGITTTLIALIANAGPEDQAIATAVSYLFRSLGAVFGISVGSTLVQDTLRGLLRKRLAGQDIDIDQIVRRVRESLNYIDELEPNIRSIVRTSYDEALPAAFWFAVVTAGAALVSSWFIAEKALTRK